MPRPAWLFVVLALSLVALVGAVFVAEQFTRRDAVRVGSVGLVIGLVLRVSGYHSVVVSGIDHGRWLVRTQEILATHRVTGSDMYAAAPFYLLELASSQLVLGVQLQQTRFVTILIAAVVPLFVGVLTYRLGADYRTATFALLVAVPQMLLLRTSTLLESESMAIPWFLLSLIFLIRYLQTDDRRDLVLLASLIVSSVFLHFLYAVVIFGTVTGSVGVLYVVKRFSPTTALLTNRQSSNLSVVSGGSALFILTWILLSTYRTQALDVLGSAMRPGDTDEGNETEVSTATPESTPNQTATDRGSSANGTEQPPGGSSQPTPPQEGQSSMVGEFLDRLLGLVSPVIPSSGTAGQSVGTGTWGSGFLFIGAFAPLGTLLTLSGIGSLVSLRRRRETDVVLLAGAVTVATAAVFGVFVGLTFNLGYRLYYFVSIFLVVFAAIALRETAAIGGDSRTAVRLLLLALLLSYGALGPVSPFGNNVDPKVGGSPWRLTATEHQQIESVDDVLVGDESIHHQVPQIPAHLRVTGSDAELILTRTQCRRGNQLVDAGDLRICRRYSR